MARMTFARWRIVHRSATALVALMSLAHVALTATYDAWTPSAVWFAGTGLGLLALAVFNWAHVGLETCRLPTAPAVRGVNVVYALFGIAAVVAVPQAHAFLLLGALVTQALASWFTLRGD
jgi:hypothetical protein